MFPVILCRRTAAAVMTALLLTGCASGSREETVKPTVTAPTAAPTAPPQPSGPVITETELYNDGGIVVTATSLEDSHFGPSVGITISNGSGKNVMISTQKLSVNGYMMSASSLYSEVGAGKKAIDELILMASELEQAGIGVIGELAFHLNISDLETYETIADSELITLKTSSAGTFTQPMDDSGQLVYDQEGVRVIFRGLREDDLWDGMAVFHLANASERNVTVCAENVSINGDMVDTSMWTNLRSNTRAVDGMYLLDLTALNLDAIDQVQTLEFTLRILDSSDWSDIASSGPVTLAFG